MTRKPRRQINPEKVRAALTARRLSQPELGRIIGRPQSSIASVLAGKSKSPSFAREMARALGVAEEFLFDEEPRDANETLQVGNVTYLQPTVPSGDIRITMPVYSSAEGGPGVLIIGSDPVDWMARPDELVHVKDGFGVRVTGDSMDPAFCHGDIAYIDPTQRPANGDFCIIYQTDEDLGEDRAMLKRLVRSNATEWVVAQMDPKREFNLPKAKWQRIFKVVGQKRR